MKYGFVGVGTMGEPMARNLKAAGFDVAVFVRNETVKARMEQDGFELHTDLTRLARSVDRMYMCLPNDEIVKEVVRTTISHLKENAIYVDFSTVSPNTSRELSVLVGEKGIRYADAPISGGPMGAKAGTLTIMVGGEAQVFDELLPSLQAMGKNIRNMGGVGSGNIAKLMNQYIIGVTQSAISEAFVLGTKMGVDPRALYEVVSTSTGESHMLHRTIPNLILKRDFDARFTIDLLHKDLKLANELGKNEDIRLLSGAVAEQLFMEARMLGFGGNDIAALILPLERLAHVEVKDSSAKVDE